MANTVTSTVLDAEKLRCKALVENDLDTLDAVFDERLFYVHASGAAEGKTAMLSHLREGRVRYTGFQWIEQQLIELSPDAAVLCGRVSAEVCVMGSDKKFTLLLTSTWARTGTGWKIVTYQTTGTAA